MSSVSAYNRARSRIEHAPVARVIALCAQLSYHDPYVRELPETRLWVDRPVLRSVALSESTIAEQDAIVLVTDHQNVSYDLVQRHAQLIVDSRGVYKRGLPNVVKA